MTEDGEQASSPESSRDPHAADVPAEQSPASGSAVESLAVVDAGESGGGDSGSSPEPALDPFVTAEGTEQQAAAQTTGRVRTGKRLRKAVVIGAAAVGGLALVYGVDLLMTRGDIARGVMVAGVDVGGLSRDEGELRLRGALDPRLDGPVRLNADNEQLTLNPSDVDLTLEWDATLDEASEQPLNPFARIRALFTMDEIGVVSHADPDRFAAEIEDMADTIDRTPEEGTVHFDGITPEPVDPMPGVRLDTDAAAERILRHWVANHPVSLPVTTLPVRSTPESVRAAVVNIAEPAVSGPVTLHGDDQEAALSPEVIAEALDFQVDRSGALVPALDETIVADAVASDLGPTEKSGRDAEFLFEDGAVEVQPSEPGRAIDWDAGLPELIEVLRNEQGRKVILSYTEQPADLTTDEARELGIEEVIGEFTTGGFAPDSGVNIRRIAEEVHGAVIEPGETFSLNGYTGRRGLAEGYVHAGVISEGVPGRAVGGGISQFATTLYNAAYFAGMEDTEHKEHSYYISRYPQGREATVYQNPDGSSLIDLKFTNDSETGVVIQTVWTPSNITVRLWGTKHYEIESVNGGRYNYRAPATRTRPAGNCSPSGGASGFTTSDTRIFRDVDTEEEIRRETRTVHYNPQPRIVCQSPDANTTSGDGADAED